MKSLKTPVKSACANIAAYLRISKDDGADMESCSITNQRELIRSYIAGKEEFRGAALTDYVDDGISGSRSDRDAYLRLLSDIEQGAVDCVVVKDLSRIGRSLIDVDDLLMNHLVTLNVRFIAINNGYDSFYSPLSNLELAVINLANQHYNRDLAVKSITAKNTKSKRGEYLAHSPFGYKKSDTAKNKLVPDEEAAGYVRLIFSLACEGRGSVEIAQILNAQGIPSPSVYKTRNGWRNMWTQVIDPDYCFWTSGVVYKLIKNKVYIGTLLANRFKVTEHGKRHTAPRPSGEWIVVPNAHEPLVSEEDFTNAQAVLQKKRCYDAPGHIFGNKVKCPACGHAMIHYTKSNPRFKCGTVRATDHYGCKTHSIAQSHIENVVLASIRAYADVLIDHEEMKLAQIRKSKLTVKGLESKIAAERKSIELLEASVTKIFTSFASGKITQDAFLHKKGVVNDTIERKRSNIEKWGGELRALAEAGADEKKAAELKELRTIETLNRDVVYLLIDKILVHDENDIEIVWNGSFGGGRP
ncbi:MAG: recombinase family protein [Clostridiales bacterium]|jgi:DNA invertase Pin-like site-specific DNA recombinase|nr:recombinase family protein [Clostridiales bacterium]